MTSTHDTFFNARDNAMSRGLDMAIAGSVLVLVAPLLVITAVLVRLETPGPAIYRSKRVGRGGRQFQMFKLRTMVAEADKRGGLVTRGGDPRITRLGRWLRRTKLDELPTLINVLRGDMSLVGPRPENPISASTYSSSQMEILSIRPGITSPATIKYRHEEQLLALQADHGAAYQRIMNEKIAIDLAYFRTRTLWSDIQLLARTCRAIATPYRDA